MLRGFHFAGTLLSYSFAAGLGAEVQ